MTSWRQLGKPVASGLVLLAATQVGASAVQPHFPPAAPRQSAAAPGRRIPLAPQYIRDQINNLGKQFDGRVGIAVRSIDDGWATGWKADELYPQQSVSKLWFRSPRSTLPTKAASNLTTP
jgi:beta-lactamase class A